jgi:hypothetical protein
LPSDLALFNFDSSFELHILYVLGSISKKSTWAPQYIAQLELAAKVFADVHTISFLDTPNAKQAACNELVALFEAIAYFTLQNFFTLSSKIGTCGP